MSGSFMMLPLPGGHPPPEDDQPPARIKVALELLRHFVAKAHPWAVPMGSQVENGLELSKADERTQGEALAVLCDYLHEEEKVVDCPRCTKEGASADCYLCDGCQRISIRPAPGR